MSRPLFTPGRPRLWLAASNSGAVPSRPRPEPSLDDAQLLEALRNGDASSATSLHDRVRPQVDRTVARLLGRNDSDRDDLAQLAMIELVTTIERFRGDCSLDAWTAMVTARVVFKHIRRRKTERGIFADGDVENLVVRSQRLVGREALVKDLLVRLRRHLEALEEVKSWTFLLHDVCGYDLREIAEITGVTVAAAQTRLTRGRRELHERVAEDPELVDWLEQVETAS